MTPRSRQLLISLIVACAMFMQNLDSTIIATALPAIGNSLGESPLQLNVAITCYLLSLAVFIPISGWTADRFGARRVFSAAIVVFTLGSIGCGLANSLPMLVIARIVQGMGGAMMVPVGRLVLLRTVPKSELVRAMSYVSVPALIGPVIGPPLGGFIVTYGSWRWIFFINIPIGALGVLLVNLFIEDMRDATRRPFDLPGFVLTGVGLASLAFGFETMGRGALPAVANLGLLAIGALCLVLYVRHARRVEHPIIDLALMRIPTYAMATIGGFLFRMGLGALPFLLPLMLQVGFGLDALSSGLITFASAAGAMSNKAVVAPIIRAFGFRTVLIANTVISSAFLFGYSFFQPTTPHLVIFLALLAGGFFRSLQMTSINTLSYADVPARLLSRATSLTSMAQQLSQSVGVGTGALLLYLMLGMHGTAVSSAADFSFALAVVAGISLLSVPFFLRMSPDAGAEVSGRAARHGGLSALRLLAWNIRQGGGTRLAAIAAALARHEADVLVISEYRGGDSAARLRAALTALGYRHMTASIPPPGRNGVVIAARQPFDDGGCLSEALPEPCRIVRAYFGAVGIYGIYMPNLLKKVPYWEALIAALAAESLGAKALAIGDFNTCRAYVDEAGAIDPCAHYLDAVAAVGFCDLWRRRYPEGREFSWYSTRGNGFRIDHAFLSPALAARAGPIRYSHEDRCNGLSDHAPLMVDLEV